MLRELQNIVLKNADATRVAATQMKFGQLVEKDYESNEVKLATGKNFFFVTKERVIDGDVVAERSDYDEAFETIKKAERVVLITPMKGEMYALDHVTGFATMDAGTELQVSNGNLVAVTTGDAVAVFTGVYSDAGHELAAIEIL